ncbi:MAG: hypothetical protein ABJB69_09825, partial [Spartobacteria bacterium]
GRRKVLVLGAGDISERAARALVSRGVKDLRVSNRSLERAQELVALIGGSVIPFESWPLQCREIDILITSTSSELPLVTFETFANVLRDRVGRPLFIIDIAFPRNVEPRLHEIDGVYLYDIDSLQSVAEQAMATRRQQITAAEAIIREHVASFQETLARGAEWRTRNISAHGIGDAPVPAPES